MLAPISDAAIFLVLTIGAEGEAAVRDLLPDLAALQRTAGFRAPGAGLSVVAGIGSQSWDRLFSGGRPAELHPFRELVGERHHAVSTRGDLLFHLRAARMDLCFELAALIMDRLAGAVVVADEVHGFTYFDQRDLLGFVDGTENPAGSAAGAAVTVTGDEQFDGGSYVIVQKYLHDLSTWNSLTVEQQERAIGRTKLGNVELPDDVKPGDSHVALTTMADGSQIVRLNMPFGQAGQGEFGTFFIGYSATPRVTEQMLTNMFIGDPPGNTDRILDFSTAVTGSLFYVPTAGFLADLPEPPAARADRSLGIGGLARSTGSTS